MRAVPATSEVHLVMDNYGTHKVDKVRDWLATPPRYQVHFTPTSVMAEPGRTTALPRSQSAGPPRKPYRTSAQLEKAMLNYLRERNRAPKPFVWTADADLILAKSRGFLNESLTQDTSYLLLPAFPYAAKNASAVYTSRFSGDFLPSFLLRKNRP